ncbi:unnamed protein product [Rotaria sordida]|uniref:Aldehyde dehydrogenase domain-containing protein n=1 Tax=Rotaria sordida TaxID=392033 RepID=A0A813MNY9_9BILA|nr:unnamed protein product [Rotaria sordida]CAF1569209.1 unnamed protein product [Rotaria sordida]
MKYFSQLIVLKPTEQTPLSALYCVALIKEVGKKIQEATTKLNLKCVTFELECSGKRVDNKDYFIKATIFSDVKDDMQITREETICDQALFDGFKESGQEKELGRYRLEAYYQSDPDKAIETAEKGFQYDLPWRKLDPAVRAQLIHKLAYLLPHVVNYLATGFPLGIVNSVPADVPVRTTHRAVFTHAGQVCFAASRIFVHSTLHDAFVSKSVELAKKRIVDDPFNSTTEQGP